MNNEKKHFASFDSLCNNFKFNYPTASQVHILDSLVERHREKNKITKNDAFSTLLLSANMHFSNIQKCLNKKPIIINCWASWCSPCIKEIPILEAKMK
jgi:thiol-disulfide isomerase/thioredoxin